MKSNHVYIYREPGITGAFIGGDLAPFVRTVRSQLLVSFQIEKLHVSHDNSGYDPDWYLEEVTIDVPDKGEQYIFPCHRWLTGTQRDADLVPGVFRLSPFR